MNFNIFNKKKRIEEARKKAEIVKKAQIKKALKATEIQLPTGEKFLPYPSEYVTFLEELQQKPSTLYEKACKFAEKYFPINPGFKTAAKIDESLKASYTNATPKGAYSLTFLVSLIFLLIVSFAVLFLDIGLVFSLFGYVTVFIVFWYLYHNPSYRAKSMGIKMSADSVLAILYMVIYMRGSPNLEGAVKFASQNLEGPLAWDLRKLLWDIETGKHASADSALVDYVFKWKEKNKEFAEALNILRGYAVESSRREAVFDETINVILNGTRERAKHYASDLRMPMTLIYAIGILLPVMGLVLFPVILIFIAESVKPAFVFFAYNIALPAILYFIVNHILSTKPPTFSPPDISKAKGVPPMGKFYLGIKLIWILPISLGIIIPFLVLGFYGLSDPDVYLSVNYSILIITGIAAAFVSYAFLDSYQKIKVRKDIEKIEDEFAIALFQLGNTISGGMPLEIAIDKARENLKEMKISEMFEIISLNMKKFGYTFEQALFDKEVGALWYYPSKLIHSIMQTVIQSSKKSIKTAANSMVTISKYLKGVHDVKEEIEEILGETITGMKFLAMFLAPLVSGVTVTLAVIILQILTQLGSAMKNLMGSASGANAYQSLLLVPWAMGGELPITPPVFQMIVGIYMIETAILLAIFVNGVKYGDDPVGVRENIWTIVLVGIIMYVLSWLLTYSMFGDTISQLLNP